MKTVPGFALHQLGDEYMLIGEGIEQLDLNQYYTFNDSAAYLWQHIEGKDFDVNTIAQLLVAEYGIDDDDAQRDAANLVDSWLDLGIIA